ncbi:MAG: ABC transporter permease [Deltaproteobacteria bacterium]|nr:MAG: ABC transporter permease [Deltaproteobacteria bacterium]
MSEEVPSLDFSTLPPVQQGSSRPAEWAIALSHLGPKKSEAFISVVTVLSILGVLVGVAVLNAVIAVMTGFEVDLRDKILGANSHIVVLRYGGHIIDYEGVADEIRSIDGVEGVAPFVYSEMMIRSALGTEGIIFKGYSIEEGGDVTHLRGDLVNGPDGELTTDEQRTELFGSLTELVVDPTGESDPLPGIFIGRELMHNLQVQPGDTVQVINPLGGGAGLMGMPTPTVRAYRVAGVFYSGMYEYDTKWTYVVNAEAQKFLKLGDTVTGLEIRVDDIDNVEAISAEIEEKVGYPHYARHWKNLNAKLFEALKLEKFVMGLILGMIVVVAGLAIVITLTMLVLTKGREIAILKAMGATKGSILRIFFLEGAIIGIVGTAIGTVLGLIICEILSEYGYPLETDVYYLSELPVVVEPANVLTIAVGTVLVCFLATIYPAYRASSLDPVEGLRYE